MNEGSSDSQPHQEPPPSGTFNLWLGSAENPDAFEPGIRQRLGEFRFGSDLCVLCADGPTLVATLQPTAQQPRPLFRVPFALPRTRRRHLVTLGWSKGAMKILLDSKVVAEIPLTFMMWVVTVGWVLWSHRL